MYISHYITCYKVEKLQLQKALIAQEPNIIHLKSGALLVFFGVVGGRVAEIPFGRSDTQVL